MLTLQDILNMNHSEFSSAKIKLVRHKDHRPEHRELMKDKDREKLLEYQAEQSDSVFHDCDYIISFLGLDGYKSILFGVFKVNGFVEKNNKFYYDLEELTEFDYLVNRLIIDWGKAAQSWYQWYNNEKEVISILPHGYIGEFPGLLNFTLSFDELEMLIKNPDANRIWKNHLKSVNGIYLILDKKTGEQYIGSAYGKEGVWHRWDSYVKSHHGNNKELERLCNADKNYHKNFQFSILQTLPSNLTEKEMIYIENLYKEKLGTKVHGLNRN